MEGIPILPVGFVVAVAILLKKAREYRVIDQVNASQIINCKIEVGDDTMDWLVAKIDGHATGARSVQRLIEATVSRKISDGFIHGTIKDGGEYTLFVDEDNTLGLKSVA